MEFGRWNEGSLTFFSVDIQNQDSHFFHQPRSSQQRSFVRKSIINVVTPGALKKRDSSASLKSIVTAYKGTKQLLSGPLNNGIFIKHSVCWKRWLKSRVLHYNNLSTYILTRVPPIRFNKRHHTNQ